ncbi:uncharacterized protein BO80DRAFT_504367 [Aspergillus ibericus CBS 121593]|uniref:DUF7726 domain-containing protein n=1 Tax=Aspergillus ibericus CBS 121593 TaxID=1448316 RepID=A0A395GT88_9EURO|nr:hypothetical protein BO80DRAFT_504367 [Aspergillus ibericus CBS 121593]RAK97907.1 hypothetical protein BO80DRAFT_504367 [Aspergillus ibericus CBS 121593]
MLPRKRKSEVDAEIATTGSDKENQTAAAASAPAPVQVNSSTKKTCDEFRKEIREFIASGEMDAAEFQRAIDVSPRSYSEFLIRRERRKGPVPAEASAPVSAPASASATASASASAPASAPAPAKKAKKNPAPAPGFDVSAIHLDGDEDMKVPIFDTCDVVRKKMKAHLRKPGFTQAGFLRDIAKAAFPQSVKRLNSKSMADFLAYKGPTTGSSGVIFYAAYVFFEKLRVRDGKPKNDFRLEMEKIWPRGFERDNPANGRLWCGPHERPWIDKYGRVQFR